MKARACLAADLLAFVGDAEGLEQPLYQVERSEGIIGEELLLYAMTMRVTTASNTSGRCDAVTSLSRWVSRRTDC